PNSERLDASQQHEGRMRVHDSAKSGARAADRVDQVFSAGGNTTDQVCMAPEILCAGVENQVDSVFDGPLIDRCAKRAVDGADQAMVASNGCGLAQVNNPQCWIRWRLEVQQLGIRSDRPNVLVVIRRVYKRGLDAHLRQPGR